MANLSPGVEIRERDVSLRIPTVTSSTGAMVGHFEKGPLNVVTLINTEKDLVTIFGKPNNTNYRMWFTASNFIKGSDRLYLVRIEDKDVKVAGTTVGLSANGEVLFPSTPRTSEDFPILDISQVSPETAEVGVGVPFFDLDGGDSEVYHIWAIGAGTYYNDIQVAILNSTDFATLLQLKEDLAQAVLDQETQAILKKYYTGTPVTTSDPIWTGVTPPPSTNPIYEDTGDYLSLNPYVRDSVIAFDNITEKYTLISGTLSEWTTLEYGPTESDEIAVFVYNENEILDEVYVVSKTAGKRDDFGNKMYAPDVINGNSNYIYFFIGGGTDANAAGQDLISTGKFFLQGADELTTNLGLLTGEIEIAWRTYFVNKEVLEIDLLLDPDYGNDVLKRTLDDIAKNVRKDCFAILSMPIGKMLNTQTYKPVSSPYSAMKKYVQEELLINSSYSAIYGNYFKVYDPYNEVERWVPVTGFIGATIARVDFNQAQWFAPAGLNRGVIDNIVDIALNPTKAQRDVMYYNRINPIVNFFGQGIVIWGQKTMQAKPSAFDRINVRRLFLYMERSIEKLARYFLFELNDEITRSRFRGLVNSFLSEIQARRGVQDFLVVADNTNNTPDVIDRNEFVAEILVKPTRVIEFIKLTFTAVATGVDFSEVVEKR